jgi:hypothetical protein
MVLLALALYSVQPFIFCSVVPETFHHILQGQQDNISRKEERTGLCQTLIHADYDAIFSLYKFTIMPPKWSPNNMEGDKTPNKTLQCHTQNPP